MRCEAVTVGSLFAGIGGFDLGFERAGFDIKWQVEIDPYCQKVLAKHWSDVKRYGDICDVTGKQLGYVDVITGGFPCQDISTTGKGAGIEGERSGLWKEMHRIIREVRPRYVVVENVAALLGRGIGVVLGDLAEIGYDAQWQCLPASAFGAPHRRNRVWIVAYPQEQPIGAGFCESHQAGDRRRRSRNGGSEREMADANGEYVQNGGRVFPGVYRQEKITGEKRSGGGCGGWSSRQWNTEPDVGRVAHGIPARVDRLKGLGNAIVPQIAEWIAQQIIERATQCEAIQ